MLEMRGVPFGLLSRDPNNLSGAPFYAGALSNLGVLLWWTAATTALYGAALLWRGGGDPKTVGLLLSTGLLSAMLALDDLYMIHEVVAPRYAGIPNPVVVGFYVACTGVWALVHRQDILGHLPVVLGLAGIFFAVSIGVDEFATGLPMWFIWEDGSKFAGIIGWVTWTCSISYRRVAAVLSRRRDGIVAERVPEAAPQR